MPEPTVPTEGQRYEQEWPFMKAALPDESIHRIQCFRTAKMIQDNQADRAPIHTLAITALLVQGDPLLAPRFAYIRDVINLDERGNEPEIIQKTLQGGHVADLLELLPDAKRLASQSERQTLLWLAMLVMPYHHLIHCRDCYPWDWEELVARRLYGVDGLLPQESALVSDYVARLGRPAGTDPEPKSPFLGRD